MKKLLIYTIILCLFGFICTLALMADTQKDFHIEINASTSQVTVGDSLSIFCVLAFIISTGLFTHKIHKNNTVIEAIIMIDEAEAYSGPGKENTHIFTINEGTKVVIDRGQNSWNLIRLKSGAGGWVQSDCMEKI